MGGLIAQLEDVRLLGPTFVRLPAQVFYIKKAVVTAVAQMAPAYAAGGGGAEKLLGPFDVLDDHSSGVFTLTALGAPLLAERLGSIISVRASKELRASVMASLGKVPSEAPVSKREGDPFVGSPSAAPLEPYPE